MANRVVKSNPETITLLGLPIIKEGQAGEDITPGMLVEFSATNDDEIDKQDTANQDCRRAFALEHELSGKGIDTDIKDGDRLSYGIFCPGQEVYALVAGAATAIVRGDLLAAAGDGTVKKWTAGTAIAVALQDVDNSANANSTARIAIEVK